jgi:hypothetical protein
MYDFSSGSDVPKGEGNRKCSHVFKIEMNISETEDFFNQNNISTYFS